MSSDDKTRKMSNSETGAERTRLLRRPGSDEPARRHKEENKTKLVGRPHRTGEETAADREAAERLVAGWLVVISGPGRGHFAPIFDGMNSVGRDDDQDTQVDFGDATISRSGHAYVTYDYKQRRFFIQHGGKSNVVRLNDGAVLQLTELKTGDKISIGNTVFGFVGFCGESFDWQES